MEAEKAFAYSMAGRLVALEAILNRLLLRTGDPHGLLDEAEMALDRAHGDHLAGLPPSQGLGFLEIFRHASRLIENTREGIVRQPPHAPEQSQTEVAPF